MVFTKFVILTLAPFLLVGGVGLTLIGMAGYLLWRSQQVKHWQATPGKILEASVKEVLVKNRKRYQTIVRYEYFVQGQPYISHRLYFGSAWRISSQAFARNRLTKYRSSPYVTVYYNPAQPKEAVLEKESDRVLIWTIAGFGSLFFMVSLFLGSVILSGSLETCGITPDAFQPRPGSPAWCYNWFS